MTKDLKIAGYSRARLEHLSKQLENSEPEAEAVFAALGLFDHAVKLDAALDAALEVINCYRELQK